MAFFDLIHTDSCSAARAGVVHTDHGDILTPIFMPVGTVGTVKGVQRRELEDDIKEKEAKIKSKTSEARAERRSKLADKADK